MTFKAVVIILASMFFVSAYSDELNDIVFSLKSTTMKKALVGPVVFPHKLHKELYKCKDCHPKIFIEKKGANDVTMQANIDGKYCGTAGCHNSVKAFPLDACDLCHTSTKEPSGK